MSLIKFWNRQIKKMDWSDIGLVKLGVMALTLMIAKLWSPILNLSWYTYGLIFILASIKPIYKFYSN